MTVPGYSSPLLSAPRHSPPVLEILCERVPLLKFVSTQTLNLDTEKGHDLSVCPSKTVSLKGFTPKNWEQTGNRLGTNYRRTGVK